MRVDNSTQTLEGVPYAIFTLGVLSTVVFTIVGIKWWFKKRLNFTETSLEEPEHERVVTSSITGVYRQTYNAAESIIPIERPRELPPIKPRTDRAPLPARFRPLSENFSLRRNFPEPEEVIPITRQLAKYPSREEINSPTPMFGVSSRDSQAVVVDIHIPGEVGTFRIKNDDDTDYEPVNNVVPIPIKRKLIPVERVEFDEYAINDAYEPYEANLTQDHPKMTPMDIDAIEKDSEILHNEDFKMVQLNEPRKILPNDESVFYPIKEDELQIFHPIRNDSEELFDQERTRTPSFEKVFEGKPDRTIYDEVFVQERFDEILLDDVEVRDHEHTIPVFYKEFVQDDDLFPKCKVKTVEPEELFEKCVVPEKDEKMEQVRNEESNEEEHKEISLSTASNPQMLEEQKEFMDEVEKQIEFKVDDEEDRNNFKDKKEEQIHFKNETKRRTKFDEEDDYMIEIAQNGSNHDMTTKDEVEMDSTPLDASKIVSPLPRRSKRGYAKSKKAPSLPDIISPAVNEIPPEFAVEELTPEKIEADNKLIAELGLPPPIPDPEKVIKVNGEFDDEMEAEEEEEPESITSFNEPEPEFLKPQPMRRTLSTEGMEDAPEPPPRIKIYSINPTDNNPVPSKRELKSILKIRADNRVVTFDENLEAHSPIYYTPSPDTPTTPTYPAPILTAAGSPPLVPREFRRGLLKTIEETDSSSGDEVKIQTKPNEDSEEEEEIFNRQLVIPKIVVHHDEDESPVEQVKRDYVSITPPRNLREMRQNMRRNSEELI